MSHQALVAQNKNGISLVPSPTSAKMAAARERWVWHISPHFLVLLIQHYQDSGWPIRLLENIIL